MGEIRRSDLEKIIDEKTIEILEEIKVFSTRDDDIIKVIIKRSITDGVEIGMDLVLDNLNKK